LLAYRYIGLVGLPGSGKDLVASFLRREYGFYVITLSDIVKEEVEKRGLPVTRENLSRMGKELRAVEGEAAIMIRAVKKAREAEGRFQGVVFNGLRNLEEAEVLWREFEKSCVIALYARKETRYHRLVKRGDEKDCGIKSFKDFLRRDRAELNNFHVGDTMAWSDFLVVNEGSKKELFEKISRIVRGEA